MTPEQFCYWLQGKLEDRDAPLSARELKSIADHLALVFMKVTPDKEPVSEEAREKMKELVEEARKSKHKWSTDPWGTRYC